VLVQGTPVEQPCEGGFAAERGDDELELLG
jgi:hypothetical protein